MKAQRERLPGSHIDRERPLVFFFDGKPWRGYHGDTLASALLANGVRIVGRSFKFHRPRGVFAAGAEECNALVQLEEGGFAEPNVRATLQPLYPGLRARGQNAWPSLSFDVLALLGLFKALLPASFYYKTMMWPNWRWYMGVVRRIAGLGKLPQARDAQRYATRNLHCELLIVGAGAAGIAAALAAAGSGKRIVLIDEQDRPGGALAGEADAAQWLQQSLATLATFSNVRLLRRTTVSGYYEHNVLAAVQRVTNHLGPAAPAEAPRERWWRIRAAQVVLATGAIERPLVFVNNDRPGVMLASAVRQYLHRFGVAPWQRALICTNNDSAYCCALDLLSAGIEVAAVVDLRASGGGDSAQQLKDRGVAIHYGHALIRSHGRRAVRGVTMAPVADLSGGTRTRIACDLVAVAGGWTPTVHLYSQAGGTLNFDQPAQAFLPARAQQPVRCAGAANGRAAFTEAVADGTRAAREALRALGVRDIPAPEAVTVQRGATAALWFIPDIHTRNQWVDLQFDVSVADIELAARENFVSIEHLKRYTTAGMCIDQGKTSNVNALAILATLTGRAIAEVGTTRFRPPYHPVTLGAIAGRAIGANYAPSLCLPAKRWHHQQDALFEDYGSWQRPACYPRAGEDREQAIRREVLAVRNGVALFDASALGKIAVRGADAARFVERVYANSMRKLQPGQARYGLMLNERGIVIDDGVLVCIGADHFLVHTTSGAATRIQHLFEELLQCDWPEMQVCCTNVSTGWATATLSGARAPELLHTLGCDIDFATAAFTHMQWRSGTLEGVPVRILRASYTGEPSWEISVPADHGNALFERLATVGRAYELTTHGIESLLRLRIEKGYLHIGTDTDGTTNALDLGWGPALAARGHDFIGSRSLSMASAQAADRLCFTGIEPLDPRVALSPGMHVLERDANAATRSGGHLSSCCYSATLGRHIGLGMVRAARERRGETVLLAAPDGSEIAARLVSPVFYDPQGSRLHG